MADNENLADVSVSIGADLDPVEKAIDAAKPRIAGVAERMGETIAQRMAAGLSRSQAIQQQVADKWAEINRRIQLKEAESKNPAMAAHRRVREQVERDIARHHAVVEREARRHADALGRVESEKARAAAQAAHATNIARTIAMSNAVQAVAGRLPGYAGSGMSLGAGLGAMLGPAGIAGGAITGAAVGAPIEVGSRVAGYAAAQAPEASRVEQATMKFNVVFGHLSDSVRDNVDTFAESTNRSRYQLRSFAADIGGMLQGMGLGSKDVASMSAELSKLAVDLSSFHNISQEDALTKILSGLSGELEPMRRLGPDLREANVQAKALSMGLAKTKDELTQVDKVQARYAIMLEGTKNAHGDAERSLGTYESSQRAYEAAMQEFNVTVGQVAMPVLKELNGVMVELLKKFSMSGEEATALGERVAVMWDGLQKKLRENFLYRAAEDVAKASVLEAEDALRRKRFKAVNPGKYAELEKIERAQQEDARGLSDATLQSMGLQKMPIADANDAWLKDSSLPEATKKRVRAKRIDLAKQRQKVFGDLSEEARQAEIAKAAQNKEEQAASEAASTKAARRTKAIRDAAAAAPMHGVLASLADPTGSLSAGGAYSAGPKGAAYADSAGFAEQASIGQAVASARRMLRFVMGGARPDPAAMPSGDESSRAWLRRLTRESSTEATREKSVEILGATAAGAPKSIGGLLAKMIATYTGSITAATRLGARAVRGKDPEGGGQFMAAEQFQKSVQQALFSGKKEKEAIDAAKKTAKATEDTAKAAKDTVAAVTSGLGTVTSALKGALGFGK